MAHEIIIAPKALSDIDSIVEHISADNSAAARKMLQRISNTIQLLANRPFVGSLFLVRGKPNARKMSVPPYITFYNVGTDSIMSAPNE
jgi:plasmid stabilization system protein ParE